jgi:peptidoglycan/xylan/chitin deacetylase (PgdA/CDA1 family)
MDASFLRDPLLSAYYVATLPLRKQRAASHALQGRSPIVVLFYHRIADTHPNDWSMPFDMFCSQMDWIRARYRFISLTEAQLRLASSTSFEPAVCLTFDDGYSENCLRAIPWLLEQEIPFTYFVSTQHMLENRPFPHDLAAGVPLPPNTPAEIRAMADAGVEIGAHTRTHCNLGAVDDPQQLEDEIVGSKHDLEHLIERPVRYFAFPFGLPENLSPAAFRLAFQAGFWGVCSAYGSYNLPGVDPFHIQRIHGDPSWARFRNWLTLDPIKLEKQPLFDPGDYRLCF